MARRFHITLGAKTSAGGVVVTATSMVSIDGAPMALEGNQVDCPACRGTGIIVCDGPRLSENWNGRQAALHDDLCVCQCNPAPRLIAIQERRWQTVDDGVGDVTPAVAARVAEARTPVSAATDDDMPLRMIDDATRLPHRNRPYRLELSGAVIDGVTDGDGLTKPLSAAERASLLAWHVADRES